MDHKVSRFRVAGLIGACLLVGPVASNAQDADNPLVCGNPYVIEPGDSLGSVASKVYGDPKLYEILVDANRDVIGDDPSLLGVGTSIMIPCLDDNGQPMTTEAAADAEAAMAAAVVSEGPLEPAELDTLFGPLALFPDPLVMQVLMATTYPLDVVKADRFLKDSAALSDAERATAAAKQPWDPNVQELAAGFPDLITRMADHIDWTEQAGEAVVAQTEDVLAAIQRLRSKAQENGYLTDNEAQTVEEVDDFIYIAPTDPEVVYVPTYNSEVVYTTPVSTSSPYNPVYYGGYDDDDWSDALATGAIIFGGAIILDEIFDDNDWGDGGWDGDGWGGGDSIDWNNGDINIDRGDVNIGSGNVGIGNGNVGIGDRRPGTDGRPGRPETRPGRIGGPEGDALSGRGDRTFAPDTASRDAARQKIETRKGSGASAATLPANRPAARDPARRPSTGATTNQRRPASARPATRAAPAKVAKPSRATRPSASSSRRQSGGSSFSQSGGSRASAGASRGRSSSGGRGGGGRGGGGRRR